VETKITDYFYAFDHVIRVHAYNKQYHCVIACAELLYPFRKYFPWFYISAKKKIAASCFLVNWWIVSILDLIIQTSHMSKLDIECGECVWIMKS